VNAGTRPRQREQTPVIYLLARAARVVQREYARELERHGLSVREHTVLEVVRARAGISNAEVARSLGVSPQGVNVPLARLTKLGYLEREPDSRNGRIIRFALTSSGTKLMGRTDSTVAEIERRALALLDERQQVEIGELLRLMRQAFRTT
jgi:DNA-binding MarR family transcriptional regulator